MILRSLGISTFVASVSAASSLCAQALLPLTVEFPSGAAVELTLEDLDAMDQVAFTTTTIWTDGASEFSGVPLFVLLEALDVDGQTLKLSALNDYSVEMPLAELDPDAPILATRIDGETMSIREKGPFWVMYPFDKSAEYQTETNFARSVWQLKSLAIID
ncbi:MAG: oxidoreductase [Pseudomonadota bacterium]